ELLAAHSDASLARRGPAITREQREDIAKLLYAALKPSLANIPEWAAARGENAPAPFFARKLLTPVLVDTLVESVLPMLAAVAQPDASSAESGSVRGAAISGVLDGFAAADILNLARGAGRTGVLEVGPQGKDGLIYLRSGDVIFVSCKDTKRYL